LHRRLAFVDPDLEDPAVRVLHRAPVLALAELVSDETAQPRVGVRLRVRLEDA
jgi:hypothetical protein